MMIQTNQIYNVNVEPWRAENTLNPLSRLPLLKNLIGVWLKMIFFFSPSIVSEGIRSYLMFENYLSRSDFNNWGGGTSGGTIFTIFQLVGFWPPPNHCEGQVKQRERCLLCNPLCEFTTTTPRREFQGALTGKRLLLMFCCVSG